MNNIINKYVEQQTQVVNNEYLYLEEIQTLSANDKSMNHNISAVLLSALNSVLE